jgi:hypothetical protein
MHEIAGRRPPVSAPEDQPGRSELLEGRLLAAFDLVHTSVTRVRRWLPQMQVMAA